MDWKATGQLALGALPEAAMGKTRLYNGMVANAMIAFEIFL
jgi:hypothetical protein